MSKTEQEVASPRLELTRVKAMSSIGTEMFNKPKQPPPPGNRVLEFILK